MTYSKILNPSELATTIKNLAKYRLPNPHNPHIAYFYKTKDKTITIFKNNKMLVQVNDSKNKMNTPLTSHVKQFKNYIGCDEVGVGDYFGGLVTCAVYLDASKSEIIKDLGVRDSKDLTDTQMINLYSQLIKDVQFECLVFSPDQYNKLVSKYQNTHIVKSYMHDITIKKLIKKISTNKNIPVVMDQYAPGKTYYSYFHKIGTKPYPISLFVTHAENKYLAVACASIIARVHFLKQIQMLSKNININIPLGSSDPKILDVAKKIYDRGGKSLLQEMVKIDFATTKKII